MMHEDYSRFECCRKAANLNCTFLPVALPVPGTVPGTVALPVLYILCFTFHCESRQRYQCSQSRALWTQPGCRNPLDYPQAGNSATIYTVPGIYRYLMVYLVYLVQTYRLVYYYTTAGKSPKRPQKPISIVFCMVKILKKSPRKKGKKSPPRTLERTESLSHLRMLVAERFPHDLQKNTKKRHHNSAII